jgi:hypothetical protein
VYKQQARGGAPGLLVDWLSESPLGAPANKLASPHSTSCSLCYEANTSYTSLWLSRTKKTVKKQRTALLAGCGGAARPA